MRRCAEGLTTALALRCEVHDETDGRRSKELLRVQELSRECVNNGVHIVSAGHTITRGTSVIYSYRLTRVTAVRRERESITLVYKSDLGIQGTPRPWMVLAPPWPHLVLDGYATLTVITAY
ncbi:hypothetical protein CDV36_005216 [Fusarium kuroshium]|uniref:Uncharacterized protein n=1 Tax=Fusarium kuroshium TaxID=2010991 RepID=A0A3M2SC33_9HYPO|nr:hypothetical protein CDV36_005216 [Fusarium kuroshium]